MKVGDHILGPVVALGGAVIVIAASQQPKPVFGNNFGGGFFPSILGSALILSGLILGWGGWRGEAPAFRLGDWMTSPRHVANVATILGCLLLYIMISQPVGFIPSSILVLFLSLLQFSRRPLISIIVCLITILIVKVLFQDILLVPLPWGVLEPYAGALTWR